MLAVQPVVALRRQVGIGARPSRLDLVATADIESVEVGIVIAGSSLNPQIAFTSSPSLRQDEVVSRILLGSSVTRISALPC